MNQEESEHNEVDGMEKGGTYFNFLPLFTYSLCRFYWVPMKNKGCSPLELIMLQTMSIENFPSLKIFQIVTL